MVACLERVLIFRAMANSIVPFSSSTAVHFITSLQDGTSITAPISLRKCVIGVVSLNAVDNAIHSSSAVDKAISVCSLDSQMMGHIEHLITHPIMKYSDVGSSEFVVLNLPSKFASTSTSKPLSRFGSHVNPSSLVHSNNVPIIFTPVS